MSNGLPVAVVLPYDEYLRLTAKDESEVIIPHEVVRLTVKKNYSLIRAWREYLKFTQAQVAERMGISQSAYAQMEKPDANLRPSTLLKIATALNLQWEQLDEGQED